MNKTLKKILLTIPYIKRVHGNIQKLNSRIVAQQTELEQLRSHFIAKEYVENQDYKTGEANVSVGSKTPQVKLIKNLADYDEFIKKLKDNKVVDYSRYVRSYELDFYSFIKDYDYPLPQCDPFTDEYREWEINFINFLMRRDYTHDCEGFTPDFNFSEWIPTTNYNPGRRIMNMRVYAEFLNIIKPQPGEYALTMGDGYGDISEILGRSECKVTYLDISSESLRVAKHRLEQQNIHATYIQGSFFDIGNYNGLYDLVVFDASFHHCDNPLRLLAVLNKKVSNTGKICFLTEPIHPFFDRPWGMVRYDGECLAAIGNSGWMELGFRSDFFQDALHKTGFVIDGTYLMADGNNMFVATKIAN